MRHRSLGGLALAAAALVLGGCGSGGATPSAGTAGRVTPSAQISHSGGASGGTVGQAAPRPARPWNVRPPSVAALGDSITRGFNACNPLSDCPEVSWATGSRSGVDSLASRLADGARSWNLAQSGARAADLPGQARAAAAYRPAMVTVLIGANDACAAGTDAMTSVADFRTSVGDALSYIHRTLPGTQVLVASIPDLERLWSVGRSNPVERQLWRLGLCPTMLGDAASSTPAAQARRAAVRDRVIAYNTALGQECARYVRCRYDGGAVFRYPFGTGELSKWDWFHPNQTGQARLAGILSRVALTGAA